MHCNHMESTDNVWYILVVTDLTYQQFLLVHCRQYDSPIDKHINALKGDGEGLTRLPTKIVLSPIASPF